METWIRHLRGRDLRFLFLLFLNLLLIGGYVVSIQQLGLGGGHGWRRIDTAAVQQRIEAGELSRHEALWYHRRAAESSGEQ